MKYLPHIIRGLILVYFPAINLDCSISDAVCLAVLAEQCYGLLSFTPNLTAFSDGKREEMYRVLVSLGTVTFRDLQVKPGCR